MPRETKLLVYNTYLLPILTYACPIFGYAFKTNIKIIDVQYHSVIRSICNAKWYISNSEIRKALNYPSLKEYIVKIATKFFNSLDTHENAAIQLIPNYTADTKIKSPRNPNSEIRKALNYPSLKEYIVYKNTSKKDCLKPRNTPRKCLHCNSAHTANFTGCPKNPIHRKSFPAPPENSWSDSAVIVYVRALPIAIT
ncbi:hypothetical protein AVEN_142895-1 [Araneus ventricosus]|uniref:RNA-directed DNA polymerase from mobile element jockey n=1 Tax=Araneus ventricosus TaxID=182803 RepID=A0A4Y2FLM3_ARAVE|nr:hypothetical protein AVEN_142895-1 [Araneus ventricosus]